jgi:PAS domain S-box-containing protein
VDQLGQLAAVRLSHAILVLSMEGNIVEANDKILGIYGFARGELLGQHHSKLVPKSMATSDEYRTFWSKLRSGQYITGIFKQLTKSGKEIKYVISWSSCSRPFDRLSQSSVRVLPYPRCKQ